MHARGVAGIVGDPVEEEVTGRGPRGTSGVGLADRGLRGPGGEIRHRDERRHASTANKHRDWVRTIRDLVSDRDALRVLGEKMRQAVIRDLMLEDHLDEWKRAWLP